MAEDCRWLMLLFHVFYVNFPTLYSSPTWVPFYQQRGSPGWYHRDPKTSPFPRPKAVVGFDLEGSEVGIQSHIQSLPILTPRFRATFNPIREADIIFQVDKHNVNKHQALAYISTHSWDFNNANPQKNIVYNCRG